MTYYIISQQTIANLLNTLPTEDSTKLAVFIQGRMKMEFENPTAIREVVRCKDCVFWDHVVSDRGQCREMYGLGRFWRKTDYCSRGVRKYGEQA